MFFQTILFDNLLQLTLNNFWNIYTPSATLFLSIFEFAFRIHFIGIFLPLYDILENKKFSITKYITWTFVMITGSNNIIDKEFSKLFNFFPFHLLFTIWSISVSLYYISIKYIVSDDNDNDNDNEKLIKTVRFEDECNIDSDSQNSNSDSQNSNSDYSDSDSESDEYHEVLSSHQLNTIEENDNSDNSDNYDKTINEKNIYKKKED